MGAITPKVTEIAGKVGDKLESTAGKIADKIPGGEHLKETASSMVEKGVATVGESAKGMVDSSKEFINQKVDQGQQAIEKKSGSLLGEITEKIQETAESGVSMATGAVSKAGETLGSGVAKVQDVAQQ